MGVCFICPFQAAIRKELNDYKSTEMEVHESSRHLTRYADAGGNSLKSLKKKEAGLKPSDGLQISKER